MRCIKILVSIILIIFCLSSIAGTKINFTFFNHTYKPAKLHNISSYCMQNTIDTVTVLPKHSYKKTLEEDAGFFDGCEFKHSGFVFTINGQKTYFADGTGSVTSARDYMADSAYDNSTFINNHAIGAASNIDSMDNSTSWDYAYLIIDITKNGDGIHLSLSYNPVWQR